MRKAFSRKRVVIVSRQYVVVSKIWSRGLVGDGGAGALAGLHRADLLEVPSGTPIVKLWRHRWPRFFTSTTRWVDSAFTTETPTPCRPPDTL